MRIATLSKWSLGNSNANVPAHRTFLLFNRLYLRDVVETTHIFFKLMEKFCNGSVVVQDKGRSRAKKAKKATSNKSNAKPAEPESVSHFFLLFVSRHHICIRMTNIQISEERGPPLINLFIEPNVKRE